MRLEFFDAEDGDSFLVSSNGHHLLVDGGRKGAFTSNVLPSLDAIRERSEKIEAVCVSHIDADHITGILALFDLILDWRVYDYHQTIDHREFPEPSRWRPPEIGKVWHNGFEAQTKSDTRAPRRLLQSTALILASSASERIREAAEASGALATSIAQGIELAERLGPQQLNIPLNPEFEGRLMIADSGQSPLHVGDASLTLLGPTQTQLDDLRKEWTDWVAANQAKIDELNRESQRDAERLGLATTDAFFNLRTERADALAKRANVTVPNLASIMFLVREGDRKALLTGDGFAGDVVAALRAEGELGGDGLHIDVLKVPHHGSEHNSDRTFYEKVTADHYVIPSDGSHRNPDLRVVEDILKSRVGRQSSRTLTSQAGDPFTIWVTAAPDGRTTDDSEHLRQVRALIDRWQRRYPDNIRATFLTEPSFVIDLG